MKNTYELVSEFVQEFWKETGREDDLFISFEQKYRWEEHWYNITVIASPDYDGGTGGEPAVVFNFDFCEGETELRKFMCLYLDDAQRIIRDIIEERRRNNEPPEI